MKKIFLFAAATLALAACDNTDDNPVTSKVAARVTATIGESSLSRAGGTRWAEGDSIGITTTFASKVGPFINMKYTTANGDGDFTGNIIYIYNPMSIAAYYPFSGKEGTVAGMISASTPVDKQTPEEQPNFDFLFASIDRVDTDNPAVTLNFAHKMSKITFIFTNGNDGTDVSRITSYTIDRLRLNGTFDTATGDCTANIDSEATPLTFDVTGVVSDKKVLPSIILFPQTISNMKLTITDDENQYYTCNLNIPDDVLESGYNYQFTVTVSKTGLTINKASILDWNTSDLSGNASSDDDDPES